MYGLLYTDLLTLRNIIKWKQIKKIKVKIIIMTRWQRKSKKHTKLLLKVLYESHKAPASYNEGKTVYISGASLYKEHAAASEHIFLCRDREDCATASERKMCDCFLEIIST